MIPGQVWQECVTRFGWLTRWRLRLVPMQERREGSVCLRYKWLDGTLYIFGCDVVPSEMRRSTEFVDLVFDWYSIRRSCLRTSGEGRGLDKAR